MYTGLSRATTMGKSNIHDSAIFFTGHNITPHRLKNMTKINKEKKKTVKIKRRDAWINHLHHQIKQTRYSKTEIKQAFTWETTTTYNKSEVEQILNRYPNNFQLD